MIMVLNVAMDGQMLAVNVPADMLESAAGLFDKMDADMDQGWTMGREWVDKPDLNQRCQIVAEKMVTAMEAENEEMKTMMAGYILARVPNVMTVHIDVNGEVTDTELELAPQ